ncbi:MAG: hypothetical protein CVV22_01255 [Ignavibacteriae bacterium HGW-Ignavibacteriae-1]|jgi:photosystem II stability/assembly factor-like uncharacterized protein|nr:MAG: hypothetical protein CVV22_01255 [Ignavibacteriae bacterium HGW-Ignavibacteriae-1]
MKNILMVAVLLAAFFSANTAESQKTFINLSDGSELNFHKIVQMQVEHWGDAPISERKGYKQFKRWEQFWLPRTFPTGNFPEGTEIFEEMRIIDNYSKDDPSLMSSDWQSVGPFNEPNASDEQRGIGRVNVVRLHPQDENEIWIGSASGGLWRSKDAGANWETFPFTQFLSLGISDITFSKSNPAIIYVTTGDVYGSSGSRDFYSIGLIKTTNGGNTWELTNLRRELSDQKHVCKVIIHPSDPNNLTVATSEGMFKSFDGGDTWELKSDPVFFIDLKANPENHDIMYASTFSMVNGAGNIYVTEDGGMTWTSTFNGSNIVRIALAVTPAEPNLVYALIANKNNFGFHSLLESKDAGKTWETIANPTSNGNILGWYNGTLSNDFRGQGQYDLCIAASPSNSREVYVGGINIWKSNNGARNFTKNSHWVSLDPNFPYVHADIHELVFNANGSIIYSANDGGIYRSTNGGGVWTSISNGLNITQFYRIGVSQKDVSLSFLAGAQDNGTKRVKFNQWAKVHGGDGMECIIDPDDNSRVYASTYNGQFRRSLNGGNSFANMLSENYTNEKGAWTAPLILNPQNSATIFAGYQNVWVSRNYGASGSWSKISAINPGSSLIALACAPSDTNVIYAASLTKIFATYNNGANWEEIHTSERAITYLWVDENDARRIWVSKSGYTDYDKVYEINGTEVINMSGNLPNLPINCIIKQEDSPDRLYVGTDIGVFYSDFGSANWKRFGNGLPNVIVNELEIHKNSKRLVAATYGRGIWVTDLIECDGISPNIKADTDTELCPGETAVLSIDGPYSGYKWSTGESTPSITVNKTGAYSIYIVSQDACEIKSKAIFVNVREVPELNIQSNGSDFICENGETLLFASSGFESYQWSNGMTDRNITISEPGDYFVVGTTISGCTETSESITIVQKPAPAKPFISFQGNTLVASEADSYQWYLNGKKLVFERKQTIQYKQIGEYQVEISDEFGCTNISEPYSIITSVEEISETSDITISSNSENGLFQVMLSETVNDIKVEVTDYTGRTLIQNNHTNINRFEIDLQNYPTSVYFVKLTIGGKSFYEKLIVK